MKRIRFVAIFAVILASLLLPTAAFAVSNWTHVGGDPLIRGGVWSANSFSYNMLNNKRVKLALGYVTAKNGTPSWVIPEAKKNIAKGNIHSSYITRGTHVGTMSYGTSVVRVMGNTVYRGQYSHLSYFYANATKYYGEVTIKGQRYRQYVTYRVSMAKPCGNVFVFHRTVKNVPVYPLCVEKRQNSNTGPRLANWLIKGKVEGKDVSKSTSATSAVLVGYFPAGSKIDLAEVNQSGWTVITGKFVTTMPNHSLTLTFVNKKLYPFCVGKHMKGEEGKFVGGVPITVSLSDGRSFEVTTSAEGLVKVADLAPGIGYTVKEHPTDGSTPFQPADGQFVGSTGETATVLVFVNQKFCPPPVEREVFLAKRLDSMSGPLVAYRWFTGGIGGVPIEAFTEDGKLTRLGKFRVGDKIDLQESISTTMPPISPSDGHFIGVVPEGEGAFVITFVNKSFCPPTPPPPHELCIKIEKSLSCADPSYLSGLFAANITDHSNGDKLTYKWTLNGAIVSSSMTYQENRLSYDTNYTLVLTVSDEAGHTSTNTITFKEAGPGNPPLL